MRRSESKLEHQKKVEKNKFYGEREGNYYHGNNNNNKTAKNNCITQIHTHRLQGERRLYHNFRHSKMNKI